MGTILCATRGGEASQPAQDVAIDMALETESRLIFLYVVDLSFLERTSAQYIVDVGGEITRMGQFLLAMAQERARERGVQAEILCRRGNPREEIMKAARQEHADVVVLGRPSGKGDFFAGDALKTFAEELEREAGVKVVIV